MGVLNDPEVLTKYKNALSLWNYNGYIEWKHTALQFVEQELPGYTPKFIGKLMHEHV